MLQTRIKICGLTSTEDARLADRMGADYLGVIFAAGARRVSPETAIAIREAVPTATLIGVFENSSLDDVITITRACGLNMIQLHGDEEPAYCDELQTRLMLPIVKAFRANELADTGRLREYTRISYVLLDMDKNVHPGESLFNGQREQLWSRAAVVRNKGYRVFLAGGLRPDNVCSAIHRVLPYGVDVASGVEKRPGVKDTEVLNRFFAEAGR